MWNGTSWSALGNGVNNLVQTIDTFNGKLYTGGFFDSAGVIRANHIAEWNGTSWTALGSGVNFFTNALFALTVYNGELIAGGGFDTAGGISANHIAAWNGTSWSSLGSGSNGDVYALTIYKGELIVGGGFTLPSRWIAQWNGTSWSAFGNGLVSGVNALTIYNSNLVAGGYIIDSAGGYRVNNITEWCDTCKPLGVNELRPANSGNELRIFPNPNNGVFQLVISNEQLVIKNTVEIYNMLGERVYSNSYRPIAISHQLITIDLSDQPAGIYLYRLISETGEQIGTGKFIIQK
jgi:hypothetical protein